MISMGHLAAQEIFDEYTMNTLVEISKIQNANIARLYVMRIEMNAAINIETVVRDVNQRRVAATT